MRISNNLTAMAVTVSALALAILCSACGSGDFNYGKVHNIIEGTQLDLDAEYVTLTQQQLNCGVQEDLWDAPQTMITGERTERTTAKLTEKGRSLSFGDDVSIGDMSKPYVQIRGQHNVTVFEISSDRDGPEQLTKIVEVRIGVPINHTCFQTPLPLMGVRKGKFTQDYNPVLFFRYNNGWYIDKLMHN
jgi:hypothetical protein